MTAASPLTQQCATEPATTEHLAAAAARGIELSAQQPSHLTKVTAARMKLHEVQTVMHQHVRPCLMSLLMADIERNPEKVAMLADKAVEHLVVSHQCFCAKAVTAVHHDTNAVSLTS